MDAIYDLDKLNESLGKLVQVTVPACGDPTELNTALCDLSKRGIELVQKLLHAKSVETKVRLSVMQKRADLEASKAETIRGDEKYSEQKNEGQRKAYLDTEYAKEVHELSSMDGQHRNVLAIVEMISEAVSCLKFLKENVSRQIQLLEIETSVERATV
jgi:hypothetical protein